MKSIIAAGFLLGCAQGAIAGPYANIEANSGFYGSDYTGTATDVHVGYEGANWYVQGGPALLQPMRYQPPKTRVSLQRPKQKQKKLTTTRKVSPKSKLKC